MNLFCQHFYAGFILNAAAQYEKTSVFLVSHSIPEEITDLP